GTRRATRIQIGAGIAAVGARVRVPTRARQREAPGAVRGEADVVELVREEIVRRKLRGGSADDDVAPDDGSREVARQRGEPFAGGPAGDRAAVVQRDVVLEDEPCVRG